VGLVLFVGDLLILLRDFLVASFFAILQPKVASFWSPFCPIHDSWVVFGQYGLLKVVGCAIPK
jgi:hypothetical protein